MSEHISNKTLLSHLGDFEPPKPTKTGTTICGAVLNDCVILGADTRATNDTIIAEKNSEKIHYIADNIYCCGAGTAADTDKVTRMVELNLKLFKMEADVDQAPFMMAKTLLKRYLYKYQGHVSAALILGGYDRKAGFQLSGIAPHGSTDTLPYTALGSGSLAAMAVLESRYRQDMSIDEGKKLVRDAIAAGVFNDLGSGNDIDLYVIKKDSVEKMRPYEIANRPIMRKGNYKYPVGTTAVLKTTKIPIEVVSTTIQREEPMEE